HLACHGKSLRSACPFTLRHRRFSGQETVGVSHRADVCTGRGGSQSGSDIGRSCGHPSRRDLGELWRGHMAIATTDPTTGEVVRTFTPLTDQEVEERISTAVEACTALKGTDFAQRSGWMQTAAGLLEADVDNLSAIMTQEMGKTLTASAAEVRKCATALRYYAEHAEAFLADKPYDAEAVGARRAFVRYFPLGPVLAVMPWNFPMWQVIRFAAPGLMAGNVGLLKHASNVPQTALYLEELFLRAGFPRGSFQTLLIPARQVESVLRDPRVKAATLTGSEPAGQSVASIAGDEIKPVVLELGGSDPFIVMPSADLDRAVETAVR